MPHTLSKYIDGVIRLAAHRNGVGFIFRYRDVSCQGATDGFLGETPSELAGSMENCGCLNVNPMCLYGGRT